MDSTPALSVQVKESGLSIEKSGVVPFWYSSDGADRKPIPKNTRHTRETEENRRSILAQVVVVDQKVKKSKSEYSTSMAFGEYRSKLLLVKNRVPSAFFTVASPGPHFSQQHETKSKNLE